MNRKARALLYRVSNNQTLQTIGGILLIVVLFNLPAIAWVLRG